MIIHIRSYPKDEVVADNLVARLRSEGYDASAFGYWGRGKSYLAECESHHDSSDFSFCIDPEKGQALPDGAQKISADSAYQDVMTYIEAHPRK